MQCWPTDDRLYKRYACSGVMLKINLEGPVSTQAFQILTSYKSFSISNDLFI